MEQKSINSIAQGFGIGFGIAVGILAACCVAAILLRKSPSLEEQLEQAVEEERYEDAAALRDQMKNKNS